MEEFSSMSKIYAKISSRQKYMWSSWKWLRTMSSQVPAKSTTPVDFFSFILALVNRVTSYPLLRVDGRRQKVELIEFLAKYHGFSTKMYTWSITILVSNSTKSNVPNTNTTKILKLEKTK